MNLSNKTGSKISFKAVLVALVFASFVSSWSGLRGQTSMETQSSTPSTQETGLPTMTSIGSPPQSSGGQQASPPALPATNLFSRIFDPDAQQLSIPAYCTLIDCFSNGGNDGVNDASYNQPNQFLSATSSSSTFDDLDLAYWQGYQQGWALVTNAEYGYRVIDPGNVYKVNYIDPQVTSNERTGYYQGRADALAQQPNQYQNQLNTDPNFILTLYNSGQYYQICYWLGYKDGYQVYSTTNNGTSDGTANASLANPVDISTILVNFSE